MFRIEIIDFLSSIEYKLKNAKKIRFVDVNTRLKDLHLFMTMMENARFIKNNNLPIDDNIIINPSCTENNVNVFYNDEFESLPIELKTVKVMAELYIFFSGRFLLSEKNCMSRTYLFLYHVGLLNDYRLRYSQSIRDTLYDEVKNKLPKVVKEYDIRFTNKKSEYYRLFCINNYKECITPLLLINNYKSQLGFKYSLNVVYDHITACSGIEFFEKLNEKISCRSSSKLQVGFKYLSRIMHLYNKDALEKDILDENNPLNPYLNNRITYVDNNGNPILDKNTKEIIDTEDKFLKLI